MIVTQSARASVRPQTSSRRQKDRERFGIRTSCHGSHLHSEPNDAARLRLTGTGAGQENSFLLPNQCRVTAVRT